MSAQNKEIYFIVGGDSLIGQHLSARLKKMGKQVLYTTRRVKAQKDNSIYLDLEKNIENWVVPSGVKVAFFCAAKTSTIFCEKNIDASRRINVVNTIKIIEKLSQKDILIIFLSSSQVFDGVSSYPDETSLATPKTEYGRQKLQVEKRLKKIAPNHSIVRATKIIHPNYPLFSDWISDLNQKNPIYPFKDFVFSPIPVDFFVTFLVKVADVKERGIWHVSGNKDLSYYDAALFIAKTIDADPSLVKYSMAKERKMGMYCMRSTVLNCSRLESIFGIQPPDVRKTIKNTAASL